MITGETPGHITTISQCKIQYACVSKPADILLGSYCLNDYVDPIAAYLQALQNSVFVLQGLMH